ncbi:MAG: beta-ketoacyl-[acyl-carrier-protein] synthase family protein [Candidatus Rokubacteria bacterium]|nr:beta-ketoacyl-[acyl-carrier-protein] synthase family protein [Candidatus Rokubacteria bacterium]
MAVTGLGIVSVLGQSAAEVVRSLRESRSGIRLVPEMKALGLRCQVGGLIGEVACAALGKRAGQSMSASGTFAALACVQALESAGIAREDVRTPRVGVCVGTGYGGNGEVERVESFYREGKSPRRLGAMGPVRMMSSSAALNLAAWLGVKGRSYALSSACATGADAIGHGFDLVRHGVLDTCLAGGAEEVWRAALTFFDNLAAMPRDYNDRPVQACRPYDRDRQGMVLSEGAGILVLEALEAARARGATILAEVAGYGSANDGADMFEPNGTGLRRCIQAAMRDARELGVTAIDYVNPHGAGTRLGDPVEVETIRALFAERPPLVSSTKPLNGHSLGAAGAHEAIFTILMLRHGFVSPTLNLDHVAPECEGVRHVRTLTEVPLRTALTFNAGLGGANAALVLRSVEP